VTLFEDGCGSRSGSLDVHYFKGDQQDRIEHDYSGGPTVCKVSRTLGSGSLRAVWPGVLDVKVKFVKPGKLERAGKAPKGCTGHVGESRAAIAKGTIDIDIHTAAFGAVAARKLAESAFASGGLSCKPAKATGGINLFGQFGPDLSLSASEPATGPSEVYVFGDGDDAPARGITGSLAVSLEGAGSLFSAPSTLDSATVGAVAPYTSGSLAFSALPACPGSPDARNGSFSGTLTIDDPVLGTLALIGSQATIADISRDNAEPGDCDGLG
jgi:hypothetical protein